jgi:hypothetical protein
LAVLLSYVPFGQKDKSNVKLKYFQKIRALKKLREPLLYGNGKKQGIYAYQ